MKPHPLILGIVALLFFGGLGGRFIVPQLLASYRFAQSYSTTSGKVIAVYPNDHCSCRYEYVVNGKKYERGGSSSCHISLGKEIPIYYSPQDPSISRNHLPMEDFYNDLIPFSLPLIAFLVFAYLEIRRRSKDSRPPEGING